MKSDTRAMLLSVLVKIPSRNTLILNTSFVYMLKAFSQIYLPVVLQPTLQCMLMAGFKFQILYITQHTICYGLRYIYST